MKLNQVLMAISLTLFIFACGKEEINQAATPLNYPDLTQISLSASAPAAKMITDRNSKSDKLATHSNVFRTSNPNDNVHYAIVFYNTSSIDKNKSHIAMDAKQTAVHLYFDASTGNLTSKMRNSDKVVVQIESGKAKLNGNILTIESLNLRQENVRKFLAIPEKSVFQKEHDDLTKKVVSQKIFMDTTPGNMFTRILQNAELQKMTSRIETLKAILAEYN